MLAFAPHLHGPHRGVKTSKVMTELSALESGGKGEIRTHGRLSPSTVFKTVALNRSAISPPWYCTKWE